MDLVPKTMTVLDIIIAAMAIGSFVLSVVLGVLRILDHRANRPRLSFAPDAIFDPDAITKSIESPKTVGRALRIGNSGRRPIGIARVIIASKVSNELHDVDVVLDEQESTLVRLDRAYVSDAEWFQIVAITTDGTEVRATRKECVRFSVALQTGLLYSYGLKWKRDGKLPRFLSNPSRRRIRKQILRLWRKN